MPPAASESVLTAGKAKRTRASRRAAGLLGLGRGAMSALLIVVTVVGTTALTALPFGWILVVAKLIDVFSLPPIVALPTLLVAIPASMIGGLKVMLAVSDFYERTRGNDGPEGRVAPVWRRGLTDTGRVTRIRMLDVVMVFSACVAIAALLIWFIAFGGSTIRL